MQENDRRVILSTNAAVGVQSVMMKDDGLTGMYYDYALAAPLMTSEPENADVLILGLGTGTYANQCLKYFPGSSVDGVEIDAEIVRLAREYFDLSDSVNVTIGDGRAYLANAGMYDVIMVDAYQDITIPFQMSTTEFFTEVKAHLRENGVMVVNMNMTVSGEDGINEYLFDTIAAVFPCTAAVDVPNNSNTELFAAADPGMLSRFEENRERLESAELAEHMQRVSAAMRTVTGGDRILTDDKAPVEMLGMKAIDELIEGELGWIREAISSGNISDILE